MAAGQNLPQAYSTILDRGFTLKSLTAPAFKGKYKVVGGTTKTFKIFTPLSQDMRDYTSLKNPAAGGSGVGASWGFAYKPGQNDEQTVTATQDKYFAIAIDKADAKFSRDGSLDASEFMRAQLEEKIYPMIDKYNIAALAAVGIAGSTAQTTTQATTKANAYETFNSMVVRQTNALVPAEGRVAFVSASFYAKIKLDPAFTPASELTAKSRRSGNWGMVDGVMVIEVPDSYMPGAKYDAVLTHENIAAAPKHLADYNQGEFKEAASGYFVNGRVIHDAFVFNAKSTGIQVLLSAAL